MSNLMIEGIKKLKNRVKNAPDTFCMSKADLLEWVSLIDSGLTSDEQKVFEYVKSLYYTESGSVVETLYLLEKRFLKEGLPEDIKKAYGGFTETNELRLVKKLVDLHENLLKLQ